MNIYADVLAKYKQLREKTQTCIRVLEYASLLSDACKMCINKY